MNQREFVTQVIDTVVAQQEAIEALEKKASEASAAPAFSSDVLKETADKLVASKLLSKEASDDLMQQFRTNPDEALLSLQKVVDHFSKSDNGVENLGQPARLPKTASEKKSGEGKAESDKAWETGFGLGS